MLKRLGGTVDPKGAATAIKDAEFPVPFASELEFNSPVHGTWNIVHTGMQVPDAHQIYVCADNCMRGVVLTAAEMNEAERFSFVILKEEHLLNGNLEDITIEGVSDVIERLEQKPKAVFLFTVCLHHFLGSDLERIYDELGKRFPEICFVRCFMDPIMRKSGLTPDQKLRLSMYDPLKKGTVTEEGQRRISILGSDFALDETSDLKRLLRCNDYQIKESPVCESWEDYLSLSDCRMMLNCYPSGKAGTEWAAERLGRPFMYLPSCFDYDEFIGQLEALSESMELLGVLDYEGEKESCEAALHEALLEVGDWPIAIDGTFHPRPMGLARLLISHGFYVERIYLDAISPEEENDFKWLQQHAPELMLLATVQVKMRVLPRKTEREMLALGQKAAWFTGSRHFVNMVQGAGLYGFDGIRRLAHLMVEAAREEKETPDLVIRKGWGCESCI